MDSFELNKIMGAVLATCLVLLVTNFAANAIFSPKMPEKPGFEIAVKEDAPAAARKPRRGAVRADRKAAADRFGREGRRRGEEMRRLPHLREGRPQPRRPESVTAVLNEPKAAPARGFNFSAAMKAKGGNWTYDDLNKFLASPKGFVPGTAMGFAGIQKDSERADVIAYLRTLSDNPAPLPTASK